MVKNGLLCGWWRAGCGLTPISANNSCAALFPKGRKDVLRREESERTERLSRVIATAEYLWDDGEAARLFLQTSHPLLDDQTPLDASMTELGARLVEEMLWKIFYGIPA